MIYPSYNDLMRIANSDVEPGDDPIVQSRYSIVIAAAKRARQLIEGEEPFVKTKINKPLSTAVDELYHSKVKILSEGSNEDDDISVFSEEIPSSELNDAEEDEHEEDNTAEAADTEGKSDNAE